MANKNFKSGTEHMDKFFSEAADPRPADAAPAPVETPVATSKRTPVKYHYFNYRIPVDLFQYLEEVAWQSRRSITQYLSTLVQADKDAKGL